MQNNKLPPLPVFPTPGIYQHFRGELYEVLMNARIESTLEEVVIYRSVKDLSLVAVRPISSFFEEVEYEGKKVKRFLEV